MQAGDEAVFGAHVGKHFQTVAAQFDAPIAGAGADASGQALVLVAVFEIGGVEVLGFTWFDRERDRPVTFPGIVERIQSGSWLRSRRD